MNFRKLLLEERTVCTPAITDEMVLWFQKRTTMHCNSVRAAGAKILPHLPNSIASGFARSVAVHDASKFEQPEHDPYVLISWRYKVGQAEFDKLDITEAMKQAMAAATEHHCKHNMHHPDAWDTTFAAGFINTANRDAVGKRTNAISPCTQLPLSKCVVIGMLCPWKEETVQSIGPIRM